MRFTNTKPLPHSPYSPNAFGDLIEQVESGLPLMVEDNIIYYWEDNYDRNLAHMREDCHNQFKKMKQATGMSELKFNVRGFDLDDNEVGR
jgi:hypothetical protein